MSFKLFASSLLIMTASIHAMDDKQLTNTNTTLKTLTETNQKIKPDYFFYRNVIISMVEPLFTLNKKVTELATDIYQGNTITSKDYEIKSINAKTIRQKYKALIKNASQMESTMKSIYTKLGWSSGLPLIGDENFPKPEVSQFDSPDTWFASLKVEQQEIIIHKFKEDQPKMLNKTLENIFNKINTPNK